MKTKKSNVKKLTAMFDHPSVKTTNGIFLIPELEVHIWPSNDDILTEWEENHAGIPVEGNLWGFCDAHSYLKAAKKAGPVRLHARSVRSHGSREEFYHTIGHELAHILEYMERHETPQTMHRARWCRLLYDIKVTFYYTYTLFFSQFRRIWEKFRMGGENTKTRKKFK